MHFIYVILMTSFGNVYSVEWDCASTTNTGTFTRSTSCTISGNNHVVVLNTLEIIGSNTDMQVDICCDNNRHFYINDASAKLTLRYVKLDGADINDNGGSIYIGPNGGELNLYSSMLSNNKGKSW